MVDLRRLHEIEELVQDSVFHPSPCRRLRERVIHDAVKANHRQHVLKRTFIASSAAAGGLLIVFFVLRFSTAAPRDHAVSNSAAIRSESDLSCPTPEKPVPSQISPAPGQSYGEWLYSQGGNPGNTVLPATEGDRSQRANSPPNRGL